MKLNKVGFCKLFLIYMMNRGSLKNKKMVRIIEINLTNLWMYESKDTIYLMDKFKKKFVRKSKINFYEIPFCSNSTKQANRLRAKT